ncbi:hypothetical protein H2199_005692 [Coniosporium tulheliwenetii]|uniref:Uncharacterized protein n=1 Tax=Coniosporium tulheliwenetii TaxID=3383036 RepID=A0ACC2Z0W8_9PEZI|nr:hypothetical protein H2199_005692 [Cladosporium sp. JES 115]
MDSMRSLNTSLPSTTPRKTFPQPPEQLLQAFKTAALSVTNLYKTAAADQARAHAEGYQEAIEELLSFLDKEDIGLDDGEGWRVRRWATERLQGAPAHTTSDSDDEAEEEKRARSSSPIATRSQAPETSQSRLETPTVSVVRPESAPPMIPQPAHEPTPEAEPESRPALSELTPPRTDFSFRSTHNYPSQDAMDTEAVEAAQSTSVFGQHIRLDALPRHVRPSTRHAQRPSTRHSSSLGNLGSGAGTKRRIPFGSILILAGLGTARMGRVGRKRGRHA